MKEAMIPHEVSISVAKRSNASRTQAHYFCGGSRRCDDEIPALRIEENAEADAGSMRLANFRYSLMPCNEAAERLNRFCESVSASALSLSGATTLVTRPSACASRAVMRSRVNTRCAAVL